VCAVLSREAVLASKATCSLYMFCLSLSATANLLHVSFHATAAMLPRVLALLFFLSRAGDLLVDGST
jgi:hypothetical protein